MQGCALATVVDLGLLIFNEFDKLKTCFAENFYPIYLIYLFVGALAVIVSILSTFLKALNKK